MTDLNIISRYGYKSLIILFIILLISLSLGFLTYLFIIIFLITLVAYRNPERVITFNKNEMILSPVDGKIFNIQTIEHNGEESILVEISNGLFDVGTLRCICDTKMEDMKLINGLFLCTYLKQSNILNTKLNIKCKYKTNNFYISIMPGALSRTIHFEKFNNKIAGDRFGFIVDGKVSIILPKKVKILVNLNDKIQACDTIGFFEEEINNEQ